MALASSSLSAANHDPRFSPNGEASSTTIQRILRLGRNAMKVVHRPLALKPVFKRGVRPVLQLSKYQKAIFLFLRTKNWSSALQLHSKMLREGYLPTSLLYVCLLKAMCATRPVETKVLRSLVDEILNGPGKTLHMDEKLLRSILETLLAVGEFEAVESTLNQYISSRRQGWVMSTRTHSLVVKAWCRAGNMEQAERWFSKYRESRDCHGPKQSTLADSAIYTTLLSGYSRLPSADLGSMYEVLRRMDVDGVQPTLLTYNVMIAAESRKDNIARAFTLFLDLQKARRQASFSGNHLTQQRLIPDAFTFGSLFRAYERYRVNHPGRLRLTTHVRPPPFTARRLFRLMLEAHHLKTDLRPWKSSPVLTTSIINVALRYYIRFRDYPAALVVLGAMFACRLQVNQLIRSTVFLGLIRRMISELQCDEQHVKPLSTSSRGFTDPSLGVGDDITARKVKWVDRMLGNENLPVTNMDASAWITLLVDLAMEEKQRWVFASSNLSESPAHSTTTAAQHPPTSPITNVVNSPPAPQSTEHQILADVDMSLLVALLRRAIKADRGIISTTETWLHGERVFLEIMEKASVEMMPQLEIREEEEICL